MSDLLYVYAVTRAPLDGVPAGTEGIGGAPVEAVELRGLSAVVSQVPAEEFEEAPLRGCLEDLDWLAGTARAHESVVRTVSGITGVVPLRLATVCRGESGVRRLLDDGYARFAANLGRLEGRVEWGVKLYATARPESSPDDGPQAGRTEREAPSSGRDYLRRRLRSRRSGEQNRAHADALARRLHTELAQRAEAHWPHRPQSGQLARADGVNVLNVAFLVSLEESEAFVELVERLTPQEEGVRVELTGPWAPYSFADLPGGGEGLSDTGEGLSGTGEGLSDAGADLSGAGEERGCA